MQKENLICVNHYSNRELARHEYWISEGRKIDTEARAARVKVLLDAVSSGPDAFGAAQILRDSVDPENGVTRAFGSTISQVHTLSSVVFSPQEKRIYIGRGGTLVPKEEYVAIDLFPGPIRRDVGFPKAEEDDFLRGRREYFYAYEAYFPGNDLARTEHHLMQAVHYQAEEGLFWTVLSLVQCKKGKWREAQASIERALSLPGTSYRERQNTLLYARILDLCGERPAALKKYQSLMEDGEFGLHARKGLRKVWREKDAQRLVIDFMLGDAIDVK